MKSVYEKKNHDYCDNFSKTFKEYGAKAACIRLEDKLQRYKSLLDSEASVTEESMIDTLLDLANYSVMTIMEYTYKEGKPEYRKKYTPDEIVDIICNKVNCEGIHCKECIMCNKSGICLIRGLRKWKRS
jgi:hypothetical protein